MANQFSEDEIGNSAPTNGLFLRHELLAAQEQPVSGSIPELAWTHLFELEHVETNIFVRISRNFQHSSRMW